MHSAFQADKVRVRFPLPAPLTSMKGPKMKLPIDEKDPTFADFLSQVLRLASSEAVITLELAVDGDTRLRVVSDLFERGLIAKSRGQDVADKLKLKAMDLVKEHRK